MSLGYADRLSYREDLGGRLGDIELHDSDEDVALKVAQLAEWVHTPHLYILYVQRPTSPSPPSFLYYKCIRNTCS